MSSFVSLIHPHTPKTFMRKSSMYMDAQTHTHHATNMSGATGLLHTFFLIRLRPTWRDYSAQIWATSWMQTCGGICIGELESIKTSCWCQIFSIQKNATFEKLAQLILDPLAVTLAFQDPHGPHCEMMRLATAHCNYDYREITCSRPAAWADHVTTIPRRNSSCTRN